MHNSCVLLLYKSHNSECVFARTMARKQKKINFFPQNKEFRLRNSRLRRSHRDIYLARRSAHPPEGFCSIGKFEEISYRTKKPVRLLIRRPACIAVNCMQVSRRIAAVQVEILASISFFHRSALLYASPKLLIPQPL